MATFCEITAYSAMFSLYILCLFVILVDSHFVFEGGTLLLIAPVPETMLLFYNVFCRGF